MLSSLGIVDASQWKIWNQCLLQYRVESGPDREVLASVTLMFVKDKGAVSLCNAWVTAKELLVLLAALERGLAVCVAVSLGRVVLTLGTLKVKGSTIT